MASVKTAISLQQHLFDQIEALAREMQISRSRLFVLAVEEFIERYQNQKLLQEINAAYEDMPEPEEQELLHGMRRQHRQLVEGQW
jgi:metal-responsive CopG/Arc/MetJ family transcriptional regulator